MKAKPLLILLLLFVVFQITGCDTDDDVNLEYTDLKSIEIGDYKFNVPSNFKLIEEQGIDSYVGRVEGSGISLTFDFGYYSGGPNLYIPENTYQILTDTINGHSRQIFIPFNPTENRTRVNFYDLNGYSQQIDSYLALSMGSNNLSQKEQEFVVEILKSGLPID